MSIRKVVTIGGHGFTEKTFVAALKTAGVTTLADVRQRRAMRGRQYAFLNRTHLEALMAKTGIRYVHAVELAPTAEIRELQREADRCARISVHDRTMLAPEYRAAYEAGVLAEFDVSTLEARLSDGDETVALLCVETDPAACHRSLAARAIAKQRRVQVEHLVPTAS